MDVDDEYHSHSNGFVESESIPSSTPTSIVSGNSAMGGQPCADPTDMAVDENKQTDEIDWHCGVCRGCDGSAADQLVVCDGCLMVVHQFCYMIDPIPESEWHCEMCLFKKAHPEVDEPPCIVCPVATAAKKQMSDGQWCHMACAFFHPEIHFEDPKRLRRPNVSRVSKRSYDRRCSLCDSYDGACIKCSRSRCTKWFHVTCAQMNKLPVFYAHTNGDEGFRAYCEAHQKENEAKTPSKPVRKRRKKSTVDILTLTSFFPRAPAKNGWDIDWAVSLYPRQRHFELGAEFDDTNKWIAQSSTSLQSTLARQCVENMESLWSNRQTNIVPQTDSIRMFRRSIGFSLLKNPLDEVMSCAQWSLWKISSERTCVLIRLFLTKKRNRVHVSQRRKKNGSLLAAHICDVAFDRDDVAFVVICSEAGTADMFWRALGFKDFSLQETRSFAHASEREINQFRDTHLLRMTRQEYLDRYYDPHDSFTAYVFEKWRKFHVKTTRRVIFQLDDQASVEARGSRY